MGSGIGRYQAALAAVQIASQIADEGIDETGRQYPVSSLPPSYHGKKGDWKTQTQLIAVIAERRGKLTAKRERENARKREREAEVRAKAKADSKAAKGAVIAR